MQVIKEITYMSQINYCIIHTIQNFINVKRLIMDRHIFYSLAFTYNFFYFAANISFHTELYYTFAQAEHIDDTVNKLHFNACTNGYIKRPPHKWTIIFVFCFIRI